METIKVLLADPRHHTVGVHSTFVPVGVGYIASYLTAAIPTQNFELKISVDPDEILNLIDDWKPNILGFSSYIWNSNLSHRLCEYAKEKNDDILCVLGGPEFPSGTNQTNFNEIVRKKCFDYLKEKSCIDYFTYSDGESAFVSIVKKYINTGFSSKLMENFNVIAEGSMNLSSDKQNILIGEPILRMGLSNKIDGRDFIPSPYLTGALDEFFKLPLIPMIETTRGCPFSCSFCADGLPSKNKIHKYDAQRTKDELEYIAKRVQGVDELVVTDLNFGMYKQDLDTANEIASIQKVYNYPKNIGAASGKNMPKRVIEVAGTVKGWAPGASIQSSDPEVLKSIKRENLSTDAYKEVIVYINSLEGGKSESEIILGMPSDTKEKHFESLRFAIDNHVTTLRMFQAMMLVGTEMASKQHRKAYGIKTKFRTIPGCIGIYDILGKKHSVVEIEEIIVASKTFKESDYLECRVMNLLIATFYNNSMFGEVFEMLKNMKVSCFDFFIYMQGHPELYSEKIKKIIKSFEKETIEVFDSWQEANDFVLDPTVINQYIGGDMGTNELLVSRALLFNEFKDVSDLMFDSVKGSLEEKNLLTQECENYLFELKSFLTMQKQDPLIKTKTVKSALFKYDFEEIRKASYHIDPNSLPVLDIPLNFDFFHDENQQNHITNQIELYSHHAFPLGKLLQKSNLNIIFRSFNKSKRQIERS